MCVCGGGGGGGGGDGGERESGRECLGTKRFSTSRKSIRMRQHEPREPVWPSGKALDW